MSALHIKVWRIVSKQCAGTNIQYGCWVFSGREHTDVFLDDHIVIHECTRTHLLVVVVVEVQALANEVLLEY